MDIGKLKKILRTVDDEELLYDLYHLSLALVQTSLGYDFIYGEYTEEKEGTIIYLNHAPVIEVTNLETDAEEYSINQRYGVIYFDSVEEIKIEYVGGFEELPEDLEFAVIMNCESIYNRLGSSGVSRESVSGYTVEYIDSFPPVIVPILDKYRRIIL